MPRRKAKAHELTTQDAFRKMFPKKVRELTSAELEKTRKTGEKKSTKKDSS